MRIAFLAVLLVLGGRCLAEMAALDRHITGTEAGTAPAAIEEAYPHPVISENGAWAATMATIIIWMFVAALLVGMLVTYHMPPEPLPEAGAHAGHDDQGKDVHAGGAVEHAAHH